MSFNPITVTQGADGYLTFFTGTDSLAGDNDATYNRITGTLRVAGAIQASPPISGTFGTGHTGTAFIWDAVTEAGLTGGIAMRFDTSFQSRANVYRWRAGGNFTPDGIAFGFFDNVPNIWMETGGLTGFNETNPVNVVDIGGGAVIGTNYAGTNTAPTDGLLIEGKLGVGTTAVSGSTQIDFGVSTTGTTTSILEVANDSTGDAFIRWALSTTRGYSLGIDNSDSDKFKIGTAANASSGVDTGTLITLTTTGNLGIGTTTPVNKLDVEGAVAIGTSYSGTSTAPTNGAIIEGSVGIGTSAVPVGAIGAAKVAIHGTDSSTAGPFIQFTTSLDNYPLYTILPYAHDNINIAYDASWDGSWKSSDVGSNFLTNKNGDVLIQYYSAGNAQGAAISWSVGHALDSAGRFGIGTSTPSTIATPAASLTVVGAADTVRINMAATTVQGTATIGFYSANLPAFAGISAAHTNKGDGGSGHLSFQTDDGTAHITRMRILDTGNVGIGTVDPHEALTINGILSLQEQDNYDRNFDGYGSLWVKSDGTIHFRNDAGTDYNLTAASGLSATEGSDGYLAFFTGANSIAGDNDLFFDRVNHRLGVGISPPLYKLHIQAINSSYPEIISHPDSTLEVGWFVDEARGAFGSKSNHEFGLMAGDVVGLTLKKIGVTPSVGIGTRFPIEPLTVVGAIAVSEDVQPATEDGYGKIWVDTNGELNFVDDNGNNVLITTGGAVNASGSGVQKTSGFTGADGYITFWTGSNEIAGDNDFFWDRVNNRLGVGTSTPSFGVHIKGPGDSFGSWLAIGIDAAGEIGAVNFRDEANSGQGGLFYDDTNNVIGLGRSISVATANGLYVDSNGDVGVNTITPVSRLEVEDNGGGSPVLKVTADDHNVYGIVVGNDTFSTTDTDGVAIYCDNSGVSVLDARGTASRLSIQVGGTDRIRITNTGLVGLSTATPQNRLDVEGACVIGASYSGTNVAPTNGLLVEGSVGIGITSVGATIVDVTQSTTSTTTSGIDISNDSTGDAFIRFGLGATRGYSLGIDNDDADKLKLGTNSNTGSGVDTNTMMVWTTAGDVGVGGTPVNGKFEVNSSANAAVVSTAFNSVSGTSARGVLQARANGGGVIMGMNSTTHSEYTRGGEAMNGAAEIVTFNAGDAVTKFIIGNVNASPMHFIINNAKVMTVSSDSLVGIKTSTPIEALTVNGVVALEEQGSTPVTQDGYGKLYTNSTGDLSYVDDGGANIQITHPDGYVNWTPSWINVIVKDADTGGDANERTIPTDAFWTGGAVDTTITGRGIYFQSNNGQFNVTKAGVYRFFAQIPWNDSDTNTGNITFRVKQNGSTVVWLFDERWNNSTDVSPKTTVIDTIVELAAGDTLEITWNPRASTALINPLGSWFTIGMEQISTM